MEVKFNITNVKKEYNRRKYTQTYEMYGADEKIRIVNIPSEKIMNMAEKAAATAESKKDYYHCLSLCITVCICCTIMGVLLAVWNMLYNRMDASDVINPTMLIFLNACVVALIIDGCIIAYLRCRKETELCVWYYALKGQFPEKKLTVKEMYGILMAAEFINFSNRICDDKEYDGRSAQICINYGTAQETTETRIDLIWTQMVEKDVNQIKHSMMLLGDIHETEDMCEHEFEFDVATGVFKRGTKAKQDSIQTVSLSKEPT